MKKIKCISDAVMIDDNTVRVCIDHFLLNNGEVICDNEYKYIKFAQYGSADMVYCYLNSWYSLEEWYDIAGIKDKAKISSFLENAIGYRYKSNEPLLFASIQVAYHFFSYLACCSRETVYSILSYYKNRHMTLQQPEISEMDFSVLHKVIKDKKDELLCEEAALRVQLLEIIQVSDFRDWDNFYDTFCEHIEKLDIVKEAIKEVTKLESAAVNLEKEINDETRDTAKSC